MKCLDKRHETAIEKAADASVALWGKHNEIKPQTTEYCMHTAYLICRNDLSFKMQPPLVELQQLNGVNIGCMLHSDKACRNMLMFIADKMTAQLVKFIKKKHPTNSH